MRYILIKCKKLKLLINEGLHMQSLLDNLKEIELLEKKVSSFYSNMLNASDDDARSIANEVENLTSKIGYKIIGVPFSNHDAELYALDKRLDYEELMLE